MRDLTHQMEAQDLASAREMVQMILRDWDWLTWDTLLADDIALSLQLGAAGVNKTHGFGAVGGNLQVTGRDEAKRVLKEIYAGLREGLLVTTEIVSGYDAILLGNFSREPANENAGDLSLPIVLYMTFSDEGKIGKMTIAAADLSSLIEAILAAVQSNAKHLGLSSAQAYSPACKQLEKLHDFCQPGRH